LLAFKVVSYYNASNEKAAGTERTPNMPTGYTAKLMESGQTFQDFVMQCARAFGACVMMRDDPMDAPIPERFEPSDYNVLRLAEAKAELARLQTMTNGEKISFGESKKAESIASSEKWLAKEIEQNKRLEEMEASVNKWTPPSAAHTRLKAFMLQQIGVSKNSTDYIEKSMAETRAKAPMDFYKEAVASAERDIEYNTKGHTKEVERANSRTEWVRQLRASI
jgi:hypothetical protein